MRKSSLNAGFGVLGPSEKWSRPAAETEETKGESEADSKSKASSSPYKKTLFSASPVRSTATLSHRYILSMHHNR